MTLAPGTDPKEFFSVEFYPMLIFKHSDWLFKFVNQSECFF